MSKERTIKTSEELFGKAVDPSNFISTFILGHLWIEFLLIQIVKVSNPKLLRFTEKLNHAKLLEFVYGLRLIDKNHFESLKSINAMRNKLAHNIFYEPTLQEYKNLILSAQKAFSDMTDGLEQTLSEIDTKSCLKDCDEFVYPELFMQIAYDLEEIYRNYGGEFNEYETS